MFYIGPGSNSSCFFPSFSLIEGSEKGWIPEGVSAVSLQYLLSVAKICAINSSCDTVVRNGRKTIAFFCYFEYSRSFAGGSCEGKLLPPGLIQLTLTNLVFWS